MQGYMGILNRKTTIQKETRSDNCMSYYKVDTKIALKKELELFLLIQAGRSLYS
jgi:hypothetical protein